MRVRTLLLVLVVIGVQAGYLRIVEQRHRQLLDAAITTVEARVSAVETLTQTQLSPVSGWRRDVKRRLKRIERYCCVEEHP